MPRAKAEFEMTTWDEAPYDEVEGAAGTARAEVRAAYRGDLEGESTAQGLITYGADGATTYVWQERFVGRLGGREGAFVFQGTGTWEQDMARYLLTVTPGSGSGALTGLRGEATVEAGKQTPAQVTLDYELPAG